jgi:hypothetical protein
METQELSLFYLDTLKEEGYVPRIDERGSVVFKVEGVNFYIEKVDEKNTKLFRMYIGFINECNNKKDEINLLQIASYTNALTPFVKTFIRKDEDRVISLFSIEALVNRKEDVTLNITTWIHALVDAHFAFNTIADEMNGRNEKADIVQNFRNSTKNLTENEEQIFIREIGRTLTYTLTNNMEELVNAIYKKTGINLGKIPESEWEVNTKLSQAVKDLMNKHGVSYSTTAWIEDSCLHLVINHKIKNKYYLFSGHTINGQFVTWSKIKEYIAQLSPRSGE